MSFEKLGHATSRHITRSATDEVSKDIGVCMSVRIAKADAEQASWGLQRIMFPRAGFRLVDVVEYYSAVAPYMLPHLKSHPATLKRYPDEVAGDVYYEKDAPAFTPKWVKRYGVWRRTGESQIQYVVVKDKRTLLWATGVGTVEFHPFLGTVADFDRPSSVVFDLDPGQGADIVNCARVALLLRGVLERLNLEAFVKVSGSKGLQVYLPLNTDVSFVATQSFAKTVAALLAEQHPKEVISEMVKVERRGKVFIDWSQNADYKTTVAVYSMRAKRTTPFVSMPVRWQELDRAVESRSGHDLYFHPDAALRRLQDLGDLFRPVLDLNQSLPQAFMAGTRVLRKRTSSKSTSNVIALPSRSRQGSRRRFWLAKNGGAAVELAIEVHEQVVALALAGPLPTRKSSSVQAVSLLHRGGTQWSDEGICEIVEGSLQKGYLRLFFAGRKLKGEWVFEGRGDSWMVRKA